MENLESYLSTGVKKIIVGIGRASFLNFKGSAFMLRYFLSSKKATSIRRKYESENKHIPPFLIASITNQCNLNCKGCYAKVHHPDCKSDFEENLTPTQWGTIMSQAEELGIGFILLAGGEPFKRLDILEEAGKHPKIIFPVFTNGTMIDEKALKLLSDNPNLMPVISIEGNQVTTEKRRGEGIYGTLQSAMEKMKKEHILFGTSITVTKNNVEEVFLEQFVMDLKQQGSKAIVYVEYVPADHQSSDIAPDDQTRSYMTDCISSFREGKKAPLIISFPGDEKTSGGCLAAGRGFFHINAKGGAEPCPFSPYSDTNLLKTPLIDALESPLFTQLKVGGHLKESHSGGCILFEKEEQVKKLLEEV